MNHNRDFNLMRKSRGISGIAMHDYTNRMNRMPMANYINPSILEEREMNVTQMDVFSRLMMENIIFLGTPIDDTVSNIIVAQMLFLESKDDKNIQMYINTPGGSVYSGLAIYDTMQFVKKDVNTLTCGMAASMGFILAIAGKNRSALKHSRFLIHQPMGGAEGQASEMDIAVKEINILKKELYDIISLHTGQSFKKIEKDGDRDYWMTAEEALKYGAIDKVH